MFSKFGDQRKKYPLVIKVMFKARQLINPNFMSESTIAFVISIVKKI
jgi:hypothetical protein